MKRPKLVLLQKQGIVEMAEKWGNHETSYKGAESNLKKNSAKQVTSQVDLFQKHYKACQELEEKLGHMVVKASSNGVSGRELSDFKKDRGFYDAYKALDKEVDALWAAQVQARMMSNEAKQCVNDFKILTEHIENDLKKHARELADAQGDLEKEQAKAKSGKGTIAPSAVKLVETLNKEFKKRDAELQKMLEQIKSDSKDLTAAGGIYRKEVDQKMDTYAEKFEKMIKKTLELAPMGGADESGLPTALQARVLVVAVKKAVEVSKQISKHLKAYLEKAVKDRALGEPDFKAAKLALVQLKKMHTALAANRKKHAAAIKKAKDSKELYRQFKLADEAFLTADKAMKEAMKQIAAMAKA